MKTEQILRKSAMPVASPSYPRGPYRFVNREYLIVNNQKKTRVAIFALIAIFIVCFFYFDLGRYFTLEYFKGQQQTLQEYYAANPALTISINMGIYIAVAALSLPGAAIMTLAAGALFGNLVGLIMVSFASSIGATLAFLVSRFLLRDYVQNKFGDKLNAIGQ